MRQLAVVGAGLTLAGILLAVTLGVFMEIDVGFPTSLFSSHPIESTVSPPRQSDQQAKLADTAVIEATPQPESVAIAQSVSIGGEVLSAGTQLEFVSRQGSDVWVRYKGGEYAIPISATSLK